MSDFLTVAWWLEYSPIMQLAVTILLTGSIAWYAREQNKLNKKSIERPDWKISKISVNGDIHKSRCNVWFKNTGGIASDVKVLWVSAYSDSNTEKGESPIVDKKEDSDTTLLKRADPGDKTRIYFEVENLDNVDHLRLCICTEENTDQPLIEGEKLRESLERGEELKIG